MLFCRNAPISAIVEGYVSEYDPRHLVELEHAYIPQLLRRGEEEGLAPKMLLHNLSSRGSEEEGCPVPKQLLHNLSTLSV